MRPDQGTSSQIVIDVGNTSTAVGLWYKDDVKYVKHCDGGFDEACQAVDDLLMISTSQTVKRSLLPRVGYASVVPKLDRKWKQFAKSRGLEMINVSIDMFERSEYGMERVVPNIPPPPPRKRSRGDGGASDDDYEDEAQDAAPQEPRGPVLLTLDYQRPESIGADRIADAVGAVARYGTSIIVLDLGTAFTAAAITADGIWRGGTIAPGLPVMLDYLAQRTAQLPAIDLVRSSPPKIGRSTEDAMYLGATIGFRGMVREIVTYLKNEFKEDFRVIATGGFARRSLNQYGLPIIYDSNLTLFGIGVLTHPQVLQGQSTST